MKRRVVAMSGWALAAAALPPGPASAADADAHGTRLSIVADGAVSAVPDLATVSAGVTSRAGSASGALAANRTAMTAVMAALHRAGVADADVQTNQIALNPVVQGSDGAPPAIVGYEARNQVTVRFREVARAGGILDALVAAGATDIDGPDFGFSDPEAGLDEARTRAVAAARSRAELYARAAGLHVARIVSIDEQGTGVPGPVPVIMRMVAKTPIAAGTSERRVSVAVTFELD